MIMITNGCNCFVGTVPVPSAMIQQRYRQHSLVGGPVPRHCGGSAGVGLRAEEAPAVLSFLKRILSDDDAEMAQKRVHWSGPAK
mgnify:CR=1 FL=1